MRRAPFLTVAAFLLACPAKQAPQTTAPAPPAPRYYVVGPQATRSLGRDPVTLLPGFGVVITAQWDHAGMRIGRTRLGRELPMRDLRPARPSTFAGVELKGRPLDFGWVVRAGAVVRADPEPAGRVRARKPLYACLPLQTRDGPQDYYRIAEGWIAADDFRVPTLSPPPAGVGPDEPWLDVDLATQTLVAYVGREAQFATLVATGVGAEGSAFATPLGEHRIRAKLLATTMDNLSHTDVVPYSYEEVPFTQYIGRVALHGAFWHDQFGHRRSHGCINLSLADAERLFAFTRPQLPAGAREIAARPPFTSTLIRVRGKPAPMNGQR